MVSITTLARKLRRAADVLDDLMADDTVAKVSTIARTLHAKKTAGKVHWTQTPAGKKKLAAMSRNAWASGKRKAPKRGGS